MTKRRHKHASAEKKEAPASAGSSADTPPPGEPTPTPPASAAPTPAAPRRSSPGRGRLKSFGAFLLSVIVCAAIVPQVICESGAAGFYDGDAKTEFALADVVAKRVQAGVTPETFHTGSAHFDGEWALVTNQMAVLGLGQIILAHPEAKERYLPAIRAAVFHMVEVGSRAFGTTEWNEDGLNPEVLNGPHGHAYLGYLDMALSMQRLVDDQMSTQDAELNDRLTAALIRRMDQSPYGLIETYPQTTFPADVATVVGAIGLHSRALKQPLPEVVRRWAHDLERFRSSEGLLAQTADPDTGVSTSYSRGSGTAFSAYLIAFAHPQLSESLAHALFDNLHRTFLGFGGTLEFPDYTKWGQADMDSGPVVLGVGVSATGFAIGAARLFGTREQFYELYRTAYLFGAPASHDGGWSYLVGEGLGDAILLAMMTARPELVCFPKELSE